MGRKNLLTLILLLSGLSGISYEILYGRILGGILGDQFAVSAAVLITFLLGIGIGARYAHRLWSRLWAVEAMIGIYGIGFALSRDPIEHLLYNGMDFLPGLAGPIMLGSALLLFPALLLGCSVPLFAGYLGRMNDGPIFSRVYGIYNLGAAATALLIEFYLIRKFGVTGTVIVFGTINILSASLLYIGAGAIASVPPEPTVKTDTPRHQIISLILVSIASAIFQLFMVKISALMYGPFRESFAFVLAILLFGIAFGSFLVKRSNVTYGMLLLANIIGLLLFIVLYRDLLSIYADLYEKAVEHGTAILFLKGGILALLMGIPAVTFGATIPAMLNARNEVSKESGTLLYISSLANVGGFLIMALVLHPYLDYGVQVLLISALVTASLFAYYWNTLRTHYILPLVALMVSLTTVGLHRALWDEDLLYLSYTSFHSIKDMEQDRKDFNFPEKFKGYQDVFAINWSKGKPYFFINGYISIPMNNPSEKVVGTLGSMFSPKTKQALVLGLGSGATAATVGMLFDHTDVVEINPVVRDNQFRMTRWNFDIEHNPKVNIVIDDGIHYIQSVSKNYDLILNTVTSPLYFSSSKLYTVDFFDKIKRRLNPEGIYLTWMDTRIGSEGAHIILNTLRQRFTHCSILYVKSGYYLLIASDQAVKLRHPNLVDKAPKLKMKLMESGLIPRQLAYNVLTSEAFNPKMTSDAPINTIDKPVLEFAMASLKKQQFRAFQHQLYHTFSLDDVASSVAPSLKYDPVKQIAHLSMTLKNASITTRFEQLGHIYVRNLDVRVDDEKMAIYQQIAMTVNSAESHHQLGDQYRLRHRYKAAVLEYQRALSLDPKHKDTRFNLAACQEYQGLYVAALASYHQAALENPKDREVVYRLARVNLKMGKLTEALANIEQSLANQPAEKGYGLKARILQAMGRDSEAVKAYLDLLKLNPNEAEAQYMVNKAMAKW
ncbi:MAG: tetratricopeptide repeat protein [Gallionella sp.]